MSVSVWHADDSQTIREVDFLVVGAGLAGCSAAYFASQAGQEVVITEKSNVAAGASGRNAGFMITGLDSYYHRAVDRYGEAVTREMWHLTVETHQHWHRFIANSATPVPHKQCGSLLLAETEAEAKELEIAARALEANDIDIVYHPTDPTGRGYYAAIEQVQDCAIQPVALAEATFAQSGAELIPNNELYKIEQTNTEYATIYTRKYIFHARHVLLCTNAYSPLIDPYFVGKVIPTRAQCLVTEPLPESVFDWLGYSDYGYYYYRMTFDNRLLIGGGRKHNRRIEANTTEDRTNVAVQDLLEAYMRKRFPDVDAKIDRRWSGIMGFCIDGLPLVGTLPGRSRVGFAVGFTGHGVAMSAETTARAVDMLLTGANPGAVDARRLHTA